jgi:hypothetical protein
MGEHAVTAVVLTFNAAVGALIGTLVYLFG